VSGVPSRGIDSCTRDSPGCRAELVSGQSLPEIGGREGSQWVKAAEGLADGIRTGRYDPGERLPSLADMAAAACVHPAVMARALRRLRELGYVGYVRGHGYYVSDMPPGFG
jgi:DNA-binding GntR family transcriptional regulator